MEESQSYWKEPSLEIKVTKSAYNLSVKKLTKKHELIAAIGNEDWYRDQVSNRIKHIHSGLESITLDCSELSEPEVFSKLLARDLFTKKRIFILKNFIKIKKLEFFTNKTFNDILIFDSEKAGRSKAYKELLKKTLVIDCGKPKPWFEVGDVLGKIIGYLKQQGYTNITQDTALYLYEQVGYNLYKIMSELNKIVIYKNELNLKNSKITIADINAICVKGMHYNIFDIIDKILAGKKKKALLLLEKIFKNESNPSILLITLWYTHFENILYLKYSSEKDRELSGYIKMPPIIISKKLIPQSQKISTKKIVESLEYLTNIDLNLRKGSFDLKYYLEKFILDF